MSFSKRFPRNVNGVTKWEEVELTVEEERAVEQECRSTNKALMLQCLNDAKELEADQSVAVALFEKRASHEIYWKEEEAKKKFDAISRTHEQK